MNALPATTAAEIAKKAATTGAISGLAVAASGGSNEDALKAFVKSGGAVLVQSGQAYVKKEAADAAAAIDVDSYCTTMFGGNCAEAQEWYEEAKEYAEAAKQFKSGKPSVVFTSDGDWAVSWVPRADPEQQTSAPSVTLTYVGEGSPYFSKFQAVAGLTGKKISKTNVMGWIFLGRRKNNGVWDEPRSGALIGRTFGSLAGLVFPVDRDVNVRSAPFEACNIAETGLTGVIHTGASVRILRAQRLPPGCSNYIWAEVEAVK